ncbi:MAG: four helix bundle protein [Bacteroidota bacterium]
MSYKKLEIWQIANDLVIRIHKMTLQELPKFEMYEEGSQIRRSSKSVKSLIVEGYGRRAYKQDFIRFLINSMASNDETIDHLENLYNTESLINKELYFELLNESEKLGRKLNNFISSVQKRHNELAEPEQIYQESNNIKPESSI